MKLLILDGNSVINRAYFGVKPLTTRDGLYTHAIYGFLNIQTFHTIHESTQSIFAMAFVLFVNICNGFVNYRPFVLFFFFFRVNISYK